MIRMVFIGMLAASMLFTTSAAHAAEGGMDGEPRGYNGGGYGRNNPRGVEGGAWGNPINNGSGMCNKCEEMDWDNPQNHSISTEGWGWDVNVGMSPGVSIKGPRTTQSTTYGRTLRGVDADGNACSCNRAGGAGFGGGGNK